MTALLLFGLLMSARPAPGEAEAVAARDRAEAYFHYSLGVQSRLSGQPDEALDELRRAAKLDPTAAEIHLEIAATLREMGKFDEALREAEEAGRLAPASVDARIELARLYQIQAEGGASKALLERAAQEYEEALRLGLKDPQALLLLAGIYGQLQRPKDAIRTLNAYLELDPGNFEVHTQLGGQYLADGQTDAAAAALKRALELRPSARAYQSLGDVYARAQQNEPAILHYRKALELAPKDLRTRLALGEVLFRARQYQDALGEADTVLAADAQNLYALELKGRAHRELKDFDKAAAAAARAFAQDPSDLKVAYLRVTIAEARHDFEGAVALIETVLKRKRDGEEPAEAAGNDRVFLVHLGFALQQLNRHAEAADSFARARAQDADSDPALRTYQIEALIQAKDFDRALSEIRAARKAQPEDPELASLEATALRSRGDMAGALVIVEKLSSRTPPEEKALLTVADFYQRAKRYREAEDALRRVRSLGPQDPLRTLFQLGAVLERQKRHEDAEAVFREALKANAESAPVLNYLGYMNADRGVRVEEALALIQKAVALDPENEAYLDSLGWALFRLGRHDEAHDAMSRALARPGANAVMYDHMGDILLRRGAVAEAVAYWKKALTAEDEQEELDRARVEAKIRDHQATLDAQHPRP
jgi:tetratricopeptide (TPR) repeat protein